MSAYASVHSVERVTVRRSRHGDGTNVIEIGCNTHGGGWFAFTIFAEERLALVDDTRTDAELDAECREVEARNEIAS